MPHVIVKMYPAGRRPRRGHLRRKSPEQSARLSATATTQFRSASRMWLRRIGSKRSIGPTSRTSQSNSTKSPGTTRSELFDKACVCVKWRTIWSGSRRRRVLDNFFWMAMALIAGGLLPFLGAFNARLGVAIASPLYASMISFLVGALAIASYLFVTRPNVAWAGASGAPWYAWLGGFCGAFSLTMIILTYPKLGPGLGFGLLIAGQLLLSVILEHFNFLVVEPHPISILRLAGVALVLTGVAMIRIF